MFIPAGSASFLLSVKGLYVQELVAFEPTTLAFKCVMLSTIPVRLINTTANAWLISYQYEISVTKNNNLHSAQRSTYLH